LSSICSRGTGRKTRTRMVHNHCRWPAWTDSSPVGMEAHGRSRGRRTGDIGFTHRRSGGGGGRGRRHAAAASTTARGSRLHQRRQMRRDVRPVRLAYQPPVSSTFLSQQTSQQQPASSALLSEQTSTSHQPPANRTGW
jgi:hypothetical protein